MKTIFKQLMVFGLILVVTGCATRVGSSKKLDGYDSKLKSLAIIYSSPKFRNPAMVKKLERYNFQDMGEYISNAAPKTFPNYGINASVYVEALNSEKPSPKEKQILLIIPVEASTTGYKGHINSGPSSHPVQVTYNVNIFDRAIGKEIWRADFSTVAGGLLYSSFNEEKAAAFLNDILGKLEKDGLVEKLR